MCCRWRRRCLICFRGRNCDLRTIRNNLSWALTDWMSLCHRLRFSSPGVLTTSELLVLHILIVVDHHWLTGRTVFRAQQSALPTKGLRQLIEGQLWLHQPHGVSCNRDSQRREQHLHLGISVLRTLIKPSLESQTKYETAMSQSMLCLDS